MIPLSPNISGTIVSLFIMSITIKKNKIQNRSQKNSHTWAPLRSGCLIRLTNCCCVHYRTYTVALSFQPTHPPDSKSWHIIGVWQKIFSFLKFFKKISEYNQIMVNHWRRRPRQLMRKFLKQKVFGLQYTLSCRMHFSKTFISRCWKTDIQPAVLLVKLITAVPVSFFPALHCRLCHC